TTDTVVIRESEETLMLEDESHSKMLQKQKDLTMSEKKVNTKPVDYAALNQLSKDFETQFVPQTELTEFVNQTLRDYYDEVGISHETSVARSPQQNGVVERRNRTLIEAARTMLIYAQAPLFLWAEAVATACFTQNRSIIRLRHEKTPKLQPKADIGIFIGYAPTKKAFSIYNRRTRRIVETIHVDFDELTAMASEQNSLGPALQEMTPAIIKIQSPVILQDVGNDNLDIEVAHMGNDPLPGVSITEVASGQSSSTASPQLGSLLGSL
nr:hypothetical protein [Tanacetum cinerariifolium]